MKELKQRLQDASSACVEAYESWYNDMKDDATRQKLLDMVHELRKVSSRLEIEIALNDRKNINAKPIPIPEHKSKMEHRKDQKPLSEILPIAELKEARKRKLELQAAENDTHHYDKGDNTLALNLTEADDSQDICHVDEKHTKPKRSHTQRRRRPDSNNNNDNEDK